MTSGQRGRAAHHSPGAKEPGGRHPPGAGHAKADGRRHHRPDQVELARPHRVPSGQPHRQPRRARRNGGRQAVGQRRHAVPAGPAPARCCAARARTVSDDEINRVRRLRRHHRAAIRQRAGAAETGRSGDEGKGEQSARTATSCTKRPSTSSFAKAAAACRCCSGRWASATAAPPG